MLPCLCSIGMEGPTSGYSSWIHLPGLLLSPSNSIPICSFEVKGRKTAERPLTGSVEAEMRQIGGRKKKKESHQQQPKQKGCHLVAGEGLLLRAAYLVTWDASQKRIHSTAFVTGASAARREH